MKIVSYTDSSELAALETAWTRLAQNGLFFVPSFSELRFNLTANGSKFRLLTAVNNSQIIAIACFIYVNSTKSYQIRGKELFYLPVRVANLFGSCVVGEPDEKVIEEFLHVILEEGGFDLIHLGHIFAGSPLHKVASRLRGTITWSDERGQYVWWLIRLPGSFDEYVASLRKATRQSVARECRRFESKAPQFRVITHPEEVDIFLRDAERISRRTYQWDINCGIRNDKATREQFMRLAENGTLRCYLSYVQDKPCAFSWGELAYKRFVFFQTGYDPEYRKPSPGTALMMKMIRDLIENTDCEIFDFLWGSHEGYKSRLCTTRVGCASMQLAQMYRPYPLLIAMLEKTLHVAKNSVALVVERGPLKARFRSALRRRGIKTF
jgi:hypothetical protein